MAQIALRSSENSKGDSDRQGQPLPLNPIRPQTWILTQWPYFKTMFESGFEEAGSGIKTIHVKDIKPSNFKLFFQFIYLLWDCEAGNGGSAQRQHQHGKLGRTLHGGRSVHDR
ncbi:hypothetical protein BGZ92_009799 [Podila epicladia]|nr:hypothetical protein BGZ92_009799 [Podila epicladia]